jgi:hypothetical protein
VVEDDAGYVHISELDSKVRRMEIRVLDGLADDSFNVYVMNPAGKWVLVYSYADQYATETWVTHTITNFPACKGQKVRGTISVKIELTGPHWSGFNTYGQLAVDEIKLYEY